MGNQIHEGLVTFQKIFTNGAYTSVESKLPILVMILNENGYKATLTAYNIFMAQVSDEISEETKLFWDALAINLPIN